MSGHPSGARLEELRPGAIVLVDGCASVQFGGGRGLTLRVTSVSDRPTYRGWVWLTGYVLGPGGEAIDRRELYVQVAGLHVQRAAPVPVQRRVAARV